MRVVLDHLEIQVVDMTVSSACYDTVLAPLGGRRVMDLGAQAIGYGVGNKPDCRIGVQQTGEGFRESHIAFEHEGLLTPATHARAERGGPSRAMSTSPPSRLRRCA